MRGLAVTGSGTGANEQREDVYVDGYDHVYPRHGY